MIAALLLAASARAAVPVFSLAGGYDLPTDQPWAGVELAVYPEIGRNINPIGRLTPAWGFGDDDPFLLTEFGILGRVPEDEAVVRLGVILRLMTLLADYRTPFQAGDPAGDGVSVGFVPGAMLAVEFEFERESPFTIGARGGLGSTVSDALCPLEDPDLTRCLTWHPGFIGGFEARWRAKKGFFAEIIVGTTSSLSIGWVI